jgi:hypothetical protein
MPHLTSTAGRHAADLARKRAALTAAEARRLVDDEARELLRRALAARGLRVLNVLNDDGPELSVRCGVESCAHDSDLIDAVVTDLGFTLDPHRVSRYRERFEYVRLINSATGARVAIVISRPGVLLRGEAA